MLNIIEGYYRVIKVGNRDEPEHGNQYEMFDYTGYLKSTSLVIDECFSLSNFRTSLVRSYLLVEDEEGNDKLVLPSGFPISKDLCLPPLSKGDIVFATMNSIYILKRIGNYNE